MIQKRNLKERTSTEALSIADVDGLYNQQLFPLETDDAIAAFVLNRGYNRALDVLGFETSDIYEIKRHFLTYIAPSGTADGEPTTSDHTAACEPGNAVEAGGCSFQLNGWGRMRRSTETRDITDVTQKLYAKSPRYNIAGEMIDNDFEWDMMRLTTVMLQDMQRRIIDGNKAVAGQADGLLQLVKYGYVDPVTGEACVSMDSTVIDYNENAFHSDSGATSVTVNGVAVADGYNFYDFVASFLRKSVQRVNNSSFAGTPNFISLIPTEHLNCLIDAWVCNTHCGGEKSQMMESEVQAVLNKLKNDLMTGGTVVLAFHGVPVTFYPYDYGLLDSVNGAGATLGTILIGAPQIGNIPTTRIQIKNMSTVASHEAVTPDGHFMVSDGSRLLTWKTVDHTCYRVHTEMQWRVLLSAPWLWMKIENVACTSIFGAMSPDPLSAFYLETNLEGQRYPKATSNTFTQQTVPAVLDVTHYTLINTNLVKNAAAGLLLGATGYPTPTVTPVAAVATTAGGTITITADGAFTYTPPSATFTGVDTYVFTATNAAGVDTGTLTIIVYEVAA